MRYSTSETFIRNGVRQVFVTAMTVLVLTACGGDDSDDRAVSREPSVDIKDATVKAGEAAKELAFDWQASGDTDAVDHYRIEVNPDGNSGYISAAGADDIQATQHTLIVPVHLTDWTNALYRIVAVDTAGDTLDASGGVGLFNQVDSEELIGRFEAESPSDSDRFGQSVAMSDDGDTLAVGMRWEDGSGSGVNPPADDAGDNTGAVQVFERGADGQWQATAYIKAPNPTDGDYFGRSVALDGSGDTLVAGAAFEDGSGKGVNPSMDDAEQNKGAVYVYTRNGQGDWQHTDYIKTANDTSDTLYDSFGETVAISTDGRTLAVGVPWEDGTGTGVDPSANDTGSSTGAVYTYTRDNQGNWQPESYIKATGIADDSDYFGKTLALDDTGDTLAVGAPSEDGSGEGVDPAQDNTADASGAVYLYARGDQGDWGSGSYIKATNPETDDEFGGSVALSGGGDLLAVGAQREDGSGAGVNPPVDNAADGTGAVYLYGVDQNGDWQHEAYLKSTNPSDRDGFGEAVSLVGDGSMLAVGAGGESGSGSGVNPGVDETTQYSGATYVFDRDSAGTWKPGSYVKATNPAQGAQFGTDVALDGSGETLAVGASTEEGSGGGVIGRAYLY